MTAICVTHDVDEAFLLADRVVMMTNGPHARLGNIMQIDLPRPRSRKALLGHAGYSEYRAELRAFLEEYESGAQGKKNTVQTESPLLDRRHDGDQDDTETRYHREWHGSGSDARASA